MRGGSAVVYDQICRHVGGLATVLSARRDYATNRAIPGAREFDAEAPYRIVRLPLLRPPDRQGAGQTPGSIGHLIGDISILLRTLAVAAWLSLRERAHVVCIGDLISLGWLAWPLRHLLGRKVIFYVHGEEVTVADAGFFFRLRPWSLDQADAVIAVSAFTRDVLAARMSVPNARIRVIPNGVDVARFRPGPPDPAVRQRYAAAGRRVILGVGRLIERKGFDKLIEAMPTVLAKVPDSLCLIVGEGPLRGSLEQRVHSLGLSESVRLIGQVQEDELVALYRLAEVFSMPNRTTANGDAEGFGLVFLEANACGKPVVSGLSGGVVEAVTDGFNGLCVNGESVNEIAAALVRILTDDKLYSHLGTGALEIAARNTWERRALSYQAICDELAGRTDSFAA